MFRWQGGRPRTATGLLVLASALAIVSCSLMIDADAVTRSGDEPGRAGAPGSAGATSNSGRPRTFNDPDCWSTEKICAVDGRAECVALDHPEFGCASLGCEPCSLPHASALCGPRGGCRIAECTEVGYRDCDGDSDNGCEVDVRSSTVHCGDCGQRCAGTCVDGRCELVSRG